jgi:hypothetical protein
MDKFSFVDTALTSNPSDDTLDENSSIEDVLKVYDSGYGWTYGSCVIA